MEKKADCDFGASHFLRWESIGPPRLHGNVCVRVSMCVCVRVWMHPFARACQCVCVCVCVCVCGSAVTEEPIFGGASSPSPFLSVSRSVSKAASSCRSS